MAEKQQSKNKNDKKGNLKNKQKSTKKLKKLAANQSDTSASVKQPVVPAGEPPVTALKNIQKQLKQLTAQREEEQNRLTAFKKEIRTIKKHLNELDNELLDTVANDKSSHQLLKKLKQFKKHFDKKLKQFDKETHRLTQEISLFTDLEQRVIKRIETIEQQQVQDYIQQIQTHEEEQDTRLKLLQTDTTNIHLSLQQIKALQQAENQRINAQLEPLTPRLDSLEKDTQQLNHKTDELTRQLDKEQDFQQFENRLNSLQDAQQQLITPLVQQLNELGNELQLLKQSIAEQQTEEPSSETAQDDECFNALAQQVEQFDGLLKQSQEELKTHIQTLRDSDQTAQSEQTDQLRKQLEQLEQQLTEVAEQSTQLQNLFSDIQDQQSLEQQQSKELSEQVQTQFLMISLPRSDSQLKK